MVFYRSLNAGMNLFCIEQDEFQQLIIWTEISTHKDSELLFASLFRYQNCYCNLISVGGVGTWSSFFNSNVSFNSNCLFQIKCMLRPPFWFAYAIMFSFAKCNVSQGTWRNLLLLFCHSCSFWSFVWFWI